MMNEMSRIIKKEKFKAKSGKWIREGNTIVLLDNDFDKVGVFDMDKFSCYCVYRE